MVVTASFGVLIRECAADSNSVGITGPALTVINNRTAANQSQFFVYQDADSGFNHGYPSGLYASSIKAMGKLHIDPACVYSGTDCATDPRSMDTVRGTVFRVSFDPLVNGEFAGLNFEEPINWGVTKLGVGYDLTGATQLVFDAISPSGGIKVQFSVAGAVTPYMNIPQQWTTMAIDLGSLGLSPSALSGVHLLFGVASNDQNAPNGGEVLIDNIRFAPVPVSQTTRMALPLANQVFGVLHVANTLPGPIPIPPDQVNANLATTYESSLAVMALLKRGQAQDLASAKLIADTLAYAVGHDNQGDPIPPPVDGSTSLRNGYSSGDIGFLNFQGAGSALAGQVRLAGYSASGLCPQTGYCLLLDGASGGNNAFAISALVAAFHQFQDMRYLNAAITIGNWIYGSLLDFSGTGYGGYYTGYPDQDVLKYLQKGKSVENNADIFQAFSALADAENGLSNATAATEWTRRAYIAGDFVLQMFDSSTGHFFAGTVPLTATFGPGVSPTGMVQGNDMINTFDFLDAQTFTTMALAVSPHYQALIDWRRPMQWVASHFGRSITADGQTFQGFDLIEPAEHGANDGPAGIAWEFTAQAVVAMRLVDSVYNRNQFTSQATLYLDQILQAQTSAPFGDGLGVVGSTVQDGLTVPPYQQCLVTPFQCIGERVGLAATAWAVLADQNASPFGVNTPTLETPGNGAIGVQSSALSWDPVSDAASYDVYFGACPAPPLVGNTSATTYSLTGLTANSTYCWKVVAKSGPGAASSAIWSFTTPAANCTYSLSASSATVDGTGGTLSVALNTSLPSCAWSAASLSSWIAITSGGTGPGSGTVSLTAVANASPAPRSGYLTVAGQNLTVNQGGSVGSRFVPITPCRVADTRNAVGPFGGPTLAASTSRDFVIPNSSCNIPHTATAYSVHVTAVPPGPLGYITVWPAGQPQPNVATLTSVAGRIRLNAAIVPAGANGAISLYATDPTDLVVDLDGYFVPLSDTRGLSFYPVTPCRVADTRNAAGGLGGPSLAAHGTRTFPIGQSTCGLPANAQAYSLNFAAVPSGPLGYLTAFPTGQTLPLAATLTATSGAITGNAAIVPAGTNGSIDVYSSDNTDLVIDINGYFAAPGTGGLSLYNLTPCRVLDTRIPAGSPPFTGALNINVTASGCSFPSGAGAGVFNATVVPPAALGYLTLWPQGQPQPLAATLNAVDGAITSNLAIVPANAGSVSAFAVNPTQLVMDLFGYFGP